MSLVNVQGFGESKPIDDIKTDNKPVFKVNDFDKTIMNKASGLVKFEAINRKYSLKKLLKGAGLHPESQNMYCPFHDDELTGKPSAKYHPDTDKLYCFSESKMYHPEVFDFDDKYLQGFFLCQKYYDDIMPELQQLFRFPIHIYTEQQLKNADIINEMEERPSVSVHIRRGDYLDAENAALFGNIATDGYYDAAMKYFLDKNPDTHFYIFTNDTDYARQKYSDTDRYTIVDWNTGKYSLLDMELMSHCQGNICANSTFSLWGARLNQRPDKIMVRTLKMRNNQEVTPALMHEYWSGWVLIDENGNEV